MSQKKKLKPYLDQMRPPLSFCSLIFSLKKIKSSKKKKLLHHWELNPYWHAGNAHEISGANGNSSHSPLTFPTRSGKNPALLEACKELHFFRPRVVPRKSATPWKCDGS